MFSADTLRAVFNAALPYADYVATGRPEQQSNWNQVFDRAELTAAQRTLVAGFSREMPVLVSSGLWCGDCVQQVPLLARIAEASDRVHLRVFDRDEHAGFTSGLRVNGGNRVPVVIFCAEDFEFVGMYGDRTLARYRAIAASQLGPNCPVPGAPIAQERIRAELQDWLNEFERAQLLLRLSGRLRTKHAD